MKVKITWKYFFPDIILAKMTEKETDKCWRRCRKLSTLMSCELFWKAIWNYMQKVIKLYTPSDPTILVLSLHSRDQRSNCT